MMKSLSVILAFFALAGTSFFGCKREPPDVTEDQAKSIAEKEYPKLCDSPPITKCSDFTAKGKTKPIEANFEWAWSWISESGPRRMELMIMVDKKGLANMRLFQAAESGGAATAAAGAKPSASETAAAPAAAPKAPATLDPGLANVAYDVTSTLAKIPGRKGDGRTWKSIQLNPGLWKRLLGSDSELKTKGLASRVNVAGSKMQRRLFGNQLAMDELRENHQFQKLLANYSMGTVRPPSQAEQDKIFAYFPEILAKPFSITEEGKDPLLIQDAGDALTLDLIGGYPAPGLAGKTPGASSVAGSTATAAIPTSEAEKPASPTFKEVFSACETEIGILCLAAPSSVYQARRCLEPHRAALRSACGRTVGLKRWP